MSNASPGKWIGHTYVCACTGCAVCSGNVWECTCDVDWEEVYRPSECTSGPHVSAWDLLGTDPNFTGDLTTAEYMDEQRGNQ